MESGFALEDLTRITGLSRYDIAQVMDSTPSVVDGWLSGASTPGPAQRERLEELLHLMAILLERMTPRGIKEWMIQSNPSLGDLRPADLIVRGDITSVSRHAETILRTTITPPKYT